VTKSAWPWLRALFAAMILGVLVWRLGASTFLTGLSHIGNPAGLSAAVGLGLLLTVLSAARWCLIAHRVGLPLPLTSAVAHCYQADFLNSVLPGGVLGDVRRAFRHGREVGDVGRGVRAVILERAVNQVVVLLVGIVALYAEPSLLSVIAQSGPLIGTAAAMLVASAMAAVATRSRWNRPQLVRSVLIEARAGLLARDMWPALVLLSVAALACQLTLFLVSARIAGATAPAPRLLPLLMFALLGMGLPVSIGGWGPREGVAALAFGAAGLTAQQGVTAAVVYGLLVFVSSLPGAALFLLSRFRKSGRTPIPRWERATVHPETTTARPER
jgi:uncharacterized membrane protein YbhN (UPF0104 family)